MQVRTARPCKVTPISSICAQIQQDLSVIIKLQSNGHFWVGKAIEVWFCDQWRYCRRFDFLGKGRVSRFGACLYIKILLFASCQCYRFKKAVDKSQNMKRSFCCCCFVYGEGNLRRVLFPEVGTECRFRPSDSFVINQDGGARTLQSDRNIWGCKQSALVLIS